MRKIIFFSCLSVLLFVSQKINAQPGCPSVNAGQDQTLTCQTPCTNLTATFFATGATTSYAVTSIPYTPPYPYNSGNPIMIGIDDIWGGVENLPFSFCFFGNLYNQIVPGANGCITFDPANANQWCEWAFTNTCPYWDIISASTGPYILGPYHDIYPEIGGAIYQAVLGAYPCRTFVVNYYQVPMFDCTSDIATHQIVLYESTNIIEVYIQNAPSCPTWNDNNKVIGIQNTAGTIGFTPPGRNTTGTWSATNEAWRFTPNGTPNTTLTWYANGVSVGNTPTINVCPASTTTYTAEVVYNCCTGNDVTVTDDVVITVNNGIGLNITPAAPAICGGGSVTLTATSTDPQATFSWNTGSPNASITVSPATTTTYTVTATTPACTTQSSVTVNVGTTPVVTVNNVSVCPGESATLTANGATTYLWSNGDPNASITVSPAGTTTYTVTGTTSGCTGSGSGTVTVNSAPNAQITSFNDATCFMNNGTATASGGTGYLWSNAQTTATATGLAPGTYTVTVTNANGCTAFTSVTIINLPSPTVSISTSDETCGKANGTATANITGACPGVIYTWSSVPAQSGQTASNLPAGDYTVTISCSGCTASATGTVGFVPGVTLAMGIPVNATCSQSNGNVQVTPTGGTGPFTYLWSCTPPQYSQSMLNVPGGTYSVVVTDDNGCTASDQVIITTTAIPSISVSSQNEICNRVNGSASVAAFGGSGNYTYLWSTNPPLTTDVITGLPAGNYSVTVMDGTCSATGSVAVIDIPGPTAEFSMHPEEIVTIGDPVSFAYTAINNNVNCHWFFGDGLDGSGLTAEHIYEGMGYYNVTLVVSDINGCVDSISDTIKVKDIYAFYIPNSFTPNDNGINDIWFPKFVSANLMNYECSIFDRWGKLMFTTVNPYVGWNGTKNNDGNYDDVVPGVYVYRIKVSEIDGPRHEYIGKIMLLP